MTSGHLSPWVMIVTVVTTFSASLLYGYNIAVLNGSQQLVRCFLMRSFGKLNATNNSDCFDFNMPDDQMNDWQRGKRDEASMLYSLTNIIWILAGMAGAFSTGAISNFFGRRNGLIFNHVFMVIGAIICAPANVINNAIVLYVGRVFIGFNCGVTIGLASIYLTEVAPLHLRGAIGACHQLAVTTGILVAFILTHPKLLNQTNLWIVAQALSGVPALIGLVVHPFCPESPRFLYLNKKDKKAAIDALRRLYPRDDPEDHISEMEKETETVGDSGEVVKFRFLQLFTQPDLRMPVMLAVGIQVMQQLSGINAVMAYSTEMLKMATAGALTGDAEFYVNIGIGLFNVACTVISLPLLERFGRRTLLLVPSAILIGSLVIMLIASLLANNPSTKVPASIVFAVCIFTFVGGFAFGLGTIPGFIVAELFRQEPRSAAYSLSQGIQWMCNLVVTATFPLLKDAIGGWVFIMYLIVVSCLYVFFFFCMPETKNRSFDEIAKDLAFVRFSRKKENATLLEDTESNPGKSSTSIIHSNAHLIEKSSNDKRTPAFMDRHSPDETTTLVTNAK